MDMIRRSFSTLSRKPMRVLAVPNQSDNYSYLIIDDKSKKAAAVDSYDVNKVIRTALDNNVEISAAITTHHHHDHSGGNKLLQSKYPNIPFYGGSDKAPATSHIVKHNDAFKFENLDITCYATPCHTQDSIAFFVQDPQTQQKAVFTGDTLFTAGCGRFFEGTPEEMDHSLNKVLANLPKDTTVYNGHEYTGGNVKFALKVDPHNEFVLKLAKFVQDHSTTVGEFTIGDELNHNPFMRLSNPQIKKATGQESSNEVMRVLREMKNRG